MSVYIAGIRGMVGSAIADLANRQGMEVFGKPSKDLSFTNRDATFEEMKVVSPRYLVIAAAKVGGIGANNAFPVDFLSLNLQIQTNLLDAAFAAGVEKVLFLGSSCIYPKLADQPINEDSLLTGKLEPTNEPYALAKIAGIGLVNSYRRQFNVPWISAMPTNLYGPRDNFDLNLAHVLPALIHRIYEAKISGAPTVEIWGDGSPLREFLHVNDLAEACMLLLKKYDDPVAINVGSGQEVSIKNLAGLISEIIDYQGELVFNPSKPNGTPRKLLDNSRILALGWKPRIELETGIADTYDWFLNNKVKGSSK
jgi:GDP-L-fucose synthase